MRQAYQLARPLTVFSYDRDGFKSVNDSHGHAVGDLVLRESAAVSSPVVGTAGILGRLGGAEFLVLMPDMPLAGGLLLAERLRAAVVVHTFVLPVGNCESRRSIGHRQTISLGVAEWSNAMLDVSDLLDAADRRLYQSKHEGRDRVSGLAWPVWAQSIKVAWLREPNHGSLLTLLTLLAYLQAGIPCAARTRRAGLACFAPAGE